MNLRIIEKDDFVVFIEWINEAEIMGKYFFGRQRSVSEVEKFYETRSSEYGTFIIEKKDGTRIGILHFFEANFGGYAKSKEIGYFLIPEERGKGHTTEAVGLVLDYLFLVEPVLRIQATCATTNVASERVLQKNGFQREGILRQLGFFSGKYRDLAIFSILREEWDGPNFLEFE